MMRLVIAALSLALSVASAFGQEPGPPQPPTPPAAAAVSPTSPGFTYSPDGRRDPFVSLLRRGGDSPRGDAVRPAGLAGLLVSEVSLRGIVASRTGFVGIVQGADGRTYIVREGEPMFDGVVRRITQDTVVFLQQVNDPLSLERQREVRKVLRQTQEAQ